MLPLFKKKHIHSRQIEKLLKTGYIEDYPEDANKRNALRQAALLYRMVDSEMFRYGTEREYQKYGLRLVVHDDQPEKKAEVIGKCHIDPQGGHYGMNNTIRYVSDTYYWQGISAHVKMYCKQCEQCKMRSKFDAEEWLTLERSNIDKKRGKGMVMSEAQQELKSLGRVKKPTPPETFFIVNADRAVSFEKDQDDISVMIDSNNIEYVVETLGQSEGFDLDEVCHVLNVPDIVPIPERFRSREIETFLKHNAFPEDFTANMKCGLRGPAAQYKIIDDELYHEGNKVGTKGLRLVVHDDMPALKVKVMVECHIDEDGSHHGLNRTLNRIGEKYFWAGMSLDVRKFMIHCKICNQQRGKKLMHDSKLYEQEAQKVKERHMKKMNDNEEGIPITYETAETTDQNGQQVIQLIGTYEDITEITLPMVNQETVTTESGESVRIMQETGKSGEYKIVTTSSGSGQAYVIKELTDAVAKIEAAEAAMELDKQQAADESRIDTDAETLNIDTNQDGIVIENPEVKDISTTDHTVLKTTEGKQDEFSEVKYDGNKDSIVPGNKPEVVKVLIIDGDETKSSTDPSPMETVGHSPGIQKEEHPYVQSESGAISYYNGVIYVPKTKKTRIIEEFLKSGSMSEGYCSRATLKELSESFEIVDDVLYRRPSRYKGRQAVVHDDNPELKLKLISSHHLKKNGTHCSELVTCQNVSFKYYWEEQKWDVHRWYLTCNICVDNGVERRSQKRILNVAEQKRFLEEKRRRNRCFGGKVREIANQNKNRPADVLRALKVDSVIQTDLDFDNKTVEEIQEHFMNYATQSNRKTDSVIQLSQNGTQKMNGARIKAIVIHSADGSSSDVEIQIPENNEVASYASIEPVEELQELLIYATLDQEQLVKNLYAEKGWKYNMESLTPAESEGQSSQSPDLFIITLKVTKEQENAIKELFGGMGFQVEGELESQETGESDVHVNEIIQAEESEETITKAIDTTHTVTSQETDSVETITVKTESEESVLRQSRKTQRGSEAVKRPIEENDSPSIPVSETRRSRREIKRPRRFSPDNDVKNAPESSPKKTRYETVDDNETRKTIEKNVKANEEVKFVTRQVRGKSRNEEIMPQTNVDAHPSSVKKDGKAGQSKSNDGDTKGVVTSDVHKGKVSVMSKARIKVKKVVKTGPGMESNRKIVQIIEDDIIDSEEDYDDDDDDEFDENDDDEMDEGEDDDFNPAMEELRAAGKESMEAIKVEDGYKCSLCDVKFMSEKLCIQHGKKNTCYDNCGLCGKVYKKKDIESYMKHVTKHEKGEKLSCFTCNKVFFDAEHLRIHDRLHKNEEVAKCDSCKEGFYTWFQFASHSVLKHGGCSLYTCDICSAKLVNISFMKSELMFDGELSYFKCVMCNNQA